MNTLYPLYLKLSRRRVVVIGGGSVALRRVERLLEAGAEVTVVSPTLVEGLKALGEAGRIRWQERRYSPGDTKGAALVFLAAGDPETLKLVRAETERLGILLNAADDEASSDFHAPAVAARGDVKIAVSTGGASPSGAARIRDAIDAWLSRHEELLAAALSQGRAGRASAGAVPLPGKVYLVGAGPGDPGLLTLRAAELLRTADVVYHDRLVPEAILERISPRAEKVYVGKEAGCAARADIETLLVESARAGKAVVRLKGGDPLVFGRGGEEMAALARAGVDFEVVPGVSALNSVPGAAGIPLTLRGVSSEIVVRSGHCAESGRLPLDDSHGTTYVYFMAASRLPRVAAELRAEGLPDSTPVAVVQKGTLPGQRTTTTTVGGLDNLAESEAIEAPALVIAGEVVRCRDASFLVPLLEHALEEGEPTE